MENWRGLVLDSHMHTRFSADSEASVHGQAEAAIARGMKYICFTDHIDYDMDDPVEHLVFDLPLEEYFTRMGQVRDQYKDRLSIGIGVEMGMQLHVTDHIHETVNAYPFDYVIASMHLVKGRDPYYEEFWDRYSQEEIYRSYFEETLENITKLEDFDSLGHLDYASRYGIAYAASHGLKNIYRPERYMDMIDEILKVLIRKDKALECNSGYMKTGASITNPGPLVLKRYLELGGEMVTVGADAHAPEYVAVGYPQVKQILQEAGVRELTYFQKRRPVMIPLD